MSRRLNRAEYVNAVYDLIGLEVNGAELLPSDMAGFGFDNNADVLSITPALMARYITAATKISRVALATPDNRPATTRYKVEIGTRQDARMGEEMPFATFGGLAVKHTFPLDGEYAFQMRLTRDQDGLINGIMAEHVRSSCASTARSCKRFTIGGEYKEPDPGQLIAVPEDDVFGAKVHKHYISADDALTVRMPMKAGTRTVTAAFVESEPIPGRGRDAAVGNVIGGGGARRDRHDVDLGAVQSEHERRHADAAEDPDLQAGDRPRRGAVRAEDPRPTLDAAAPTAGSPTADATSTSCSRSIDKGRAARDFDTGIARALEALLSSPKFVLRVEEERPASQVGRLPPERSGAGLAAVVLPVEEHSRRRAARRGRRRAS